ncbi:hypothetical protein SAMN03159342_05654 [Pseudomonas sp. NFPP04]|nr:hypothetical protein SAMN03159342_05654 [Pseudomonas sp. NFPP04]SFK07915.1 hypothetical protein SAMN03159344_05656 [Pseudomonas sp. NFPP11]
MLAYSHLSTQRPDSLNISGLMNELLHFFDSGLNLEPNATLIRASAFGRLLAPMNGRYWPILLKK